MTPSEKLLGYLLAVIIKVGILYAIWNFSIAPRFGLPQGTLEEVFLFSWFIVLLATQIKIPESKQ